MTDERQTNIGRLNKIFSAEFMNAYYGANAKDKAKLSRFFPHFYRYWYYSTFMYRTILSPANIAAAASGKYDGVCSVPLANLETSEYSFIGITFSELKYSIEDHPAVRDLKKLVDLLDPDASLTKNGYFPAALEKKIFNAISVKDTFYIEYLFLLAVNLELIIKMPSININKVRVSPRAGDFFTRPPRAILTDVVEQTIEMCVLFIKSSGPYDELPIDCPFILNLLTDPVTTDEIFKTVFSTARENLDLISSAAEFADKKGDGKFPSADDLERMFTASTIYLGSLFDKYFFLPFGFYLRLIQPLYIYPFDILDTLDALDVKTPDDLIPALFMPCAAFGLTGLGMELFGTNLPHGRNLSLSPETPGSLLIDFATGRRSNKKSNQDFIAEIEKYHENILKPVYELKVSLNSDKSLWKRALVAGEFTLHGLHRFICEEFAIEEAPRYVFFAGSDDNPFARFTPPDGKNRVKLTTETELDDLGLSEGEKLIYIINDAVDSFFFRDPEQADISFKLEIVKIKKPAGIDYLPRVLRESQAFKDMNYLYGMDGEMDFDYNF